MNAALSFNSKIKVDIGALWVNPGFKKRPLTTSFVIALGIHVALFLLGGFLFNSAPEYGMQLSSGGMDIELVAAPAAGEVVEQSIMAQASRENVISEEVAIPTPPSVQPEEKIVAPNPALKSQAVGDGSSKIAGKDETTLSSSGAGQVTEKPGYLKNPPPPYPAEAIRKSQEGLVMLSVWVSRSGTVQKAEISQSSGFAVLDQSALKTVKKWKFNPARSGALAVESQVNIPVRFRLEDVRRRS